MVKEGGQVSTSDLRSRINNAEKLIYIWQGEVCVAIAGLKNPAISYKSKVFKMAGLTDKSIKYQFEIGYLYANIKGVGNDLMQGILEASKGSPVFATTRDTNSVMQHLLPKFGFIKLGKSYLNKTNEYKLGLFGREK
jgi:hypothetical protein